jgi:hypothetical protein
MTLYQYFCTSDPFSGSAKLILSVLLPSHEQRIMSSTSATPPISGNGMVPDFSVTFNGPRSIIFPRVFPLYRLYVSPVVAVDDFPDAVHAFPVAVVDA